MKSLINFFYMSVALLTMTTQSYAGLIFSGLSENQSEYLSAKAESIFKESGIFPEHVNIGDMIFKTDLFYNSDTKSGLKSVYEWAIFWPNGEIIYEPASNVNSAFLFSFQEACRLLSQKVKVSCKRRTSEENYVYLYSGNSNRANVGMQGGQQIMEIIDWQNIYIVAHELMHVLGFDHEQNRSDRDDYITVNFQNIIPEYRIFFEKNKSVPTSPYDYYSVMHYGDDDFSISGAATIVPHRRVSIGQSRDDYNDLDSTYGWR